MQSAAQAGQAVLAVGWGWLRPDFLSSDGHSQIPDGQQDLDTLSMAVPVPESEEILIVRSKPWKGGSDAGFAGGHRWKGRPENVVFC